MRIRSRLVFLVLAVLVPAFLGSAIAVGYLYREEQKFNYESMRETARALALSLDRELARRESVLHTLAGSPALQRGETERFYGFAARIGQQHDAAIILSDLEGRQVLNTRVPFGQPLPPMLREERENRARFGNEATVISDVYLPPAGLGPHSFAVQVPVWRDGTVVQFLTMATFASQMQPLVAGPGLPRSWHATILDRRGVVAARSLEPERFIGQPVREELGAKVATQSEGFHEGQTLGGVASTAFFSRAPVSGWVFLVAVPHSVLYGPATRTAVFLTSITLLLLALGAAAAVLVARRITRPVESLREAAERLGHNEPVQRRPLGTAELDQVGEAMAQASERLRGATAELERRVADAVQGFERSQRELAQAQKLEALGRLTGGIAHDFNNVLQTLSAALQTLGMHKAATHASGSELERELIERCRRAVARGTGLARQLMAFGRVQEARTETLDLAARLGEARQLFGGALPANVTLELALEPGLWPVTVDPAQLELALLNLVINARDAMPHGGRAVLRARNESLARPREPLAAGDYVVIALTDSGEGMSAEVMARALDPFYTTKGVGKGSGMGLPQAYGFARQNGGTLELDSAPSLGTTATLYLPRARRPVSAPSRQEAPAPLPPGHGRVLLVEDDAEVRETVSSALRAAGFAIDTAADAQEALARLGRGARYDALFTDVVMPGALNGLDLAREVRARYPATAVVVATGYSDRAVELPGVKALAKPFEVRQAVEALNGAMRRESDAAAGA